MLLANDAALNLSWGECGLNAEIKFSRCLASASDPVSNAL
jgi:hypothetical protein